MKILSYNVNGIRAALNKDLDKWIEITDPDILCLQETKAMKEQVETTLTRLARAGINVFQSDVYLLENTTSPVV